jgi:hypothetical protein
MSLGGGGEQKPTATEKELAKIAKEKWAFRKKVYVPAENLYIDKIKKIGSPMERQRAASAAVATSNMQRGLPGRNIQDIVSTDMTGEKGLGLQLSQSDATTTSRGNKGSESLIALGKDIENTGISGLSRQASNENIRQLGKIEADSIYSAGISDLAGTAIGYGIYKDNNKEPEIDFMSPNSGSRSSGSAAGIA